MTTEQANGHPAEDTIIPAHEQRKDKYGFVWDPEAWKHNEQVRRRQEAAKVTTLPTQYEQAKATWHLRQNIEPVFGFRDWMEGVVDPDTLEWDAHGRRKYPAVAQLPPKPQPQAKPKRMLNHEQKRSLR